MKKKEEEIDVISGEGKSKKRRWLKSADAAVTKNNRVTLTMSMVEEALTGTTLVVQGCLHTVNISDFTSCSTTTTILVIAATTGARARSTFFNRWKVVQKKSGRVVGARACHGICSMCAANILKISTLNLMTTNMWWRQRPAQYRQ